MSGKNDGPLNTEAILHLLRLSDVPYEEVTWRWRGRLPAGKLVILEGDPGTGKSWLSLAIATAVTRGQPLPGDDGEFEPQNVLLLTAEDGLADTVRPRIEDMGGDLRRVFVAALVDEADGSERFPKLPVDLPALTAALDEAELGEGGYGLVIIDPLNAYLGGVDGNRDIDVRSVLGPLASLAEVYGVPIVGIRHLTKGGRDRTIYRGAGSIAYTAAARVVLLVGINPDDETERVVVPVKNNLAALTPGVAFDLEGRFTWRGISNVTADQLLAPDAQPEERGTRAEAIEFLKDALANGPRPAAELQAQAQGLGIAPRTLKRAKADLNVISTSIYEAGVRGATAWVWSLPGATAV